MDTTQIAALLSTLAAPAELVETHISWVLLAGTDAWKIKKPVDFGFLDFSTVEKRRFCCEEELRLNRRLAPQLYLEVVPITLDGSQPRLGGSGPVLDWAVHMRRFAATEQLDAMLAAGRLEPCHIDAAALCIAAFHAGLAGIGGDSPLGSAEAIHAPARQNFVQVRAGLSEPADLARLAQLEAWSEAEFARLEDVFAQRRADGFVRECHGDLHLGNLAWHEGAVLPFDCIEFNENLRWVDVQSEIAFLAMDLHDRHRPDLAWRFLNAYLEHSGDYAGLALFRYYQVYRALVRAKVAILGGNLAGCREYLDLAHTFIAPPTPLLAITHGLSGSGKSTLAGQLGEELGAIRLRSDVERKRLAGLAARQSSGSPLGGGIYSGDWHRRTYRHLEELAQTIVSAGYRVIVDAAFLKQAERENFMALAESWGATGLILDIQAPAELLRERIEARRQAGSDASEATLAVLEKQLEDDEPLSEKEQSRAVVADARLGNGEEVVRACLQRSSDRSALPPASSNAADHR